MTRHYSQVATHRRALRILVEVMMPPALGSFFVVGYVQVASTAQIDWHVAVLSFIWAYIVAGIPVILYALAMETAFSRGVSPRSAASIALSSGLGFVAAAVLLWISDQPRGFPYGLWCIMGLIVGALVGFVLKAIDHIPE